MIKYFFVDLETTAEGGPDKNSPAAHWDVNKILLCGWKKEGGRISINDTPAALMLAMNATLLLGDTPALVAHNATFDLRWLMRFDSHFNWRKIDLWDTMTWEYLDSGHTNKFAGLEATAKQYNLRFKKSLDLGALLKQGVKMTDIPKQELIDYLNDDVEILHRVWTKQYMGSHYEMNHLLPLAEMESNGLLIDKPMLEILFTRCHNIVAAEEVKMINRLKDACEWQDGSALKDEDFSDQLGIKSKFIKPFAGRTLSFLLTGNPSSLKITNKWRVRFKRLCMPAHSGALPSYFKNPTHLGYPIDETVLSQSKSWIARSTLVHRKHNKILGTYLSPFLESMIITGGTVHPKLNTALTNTGRLSSSNPNGQNIPAVVRELVQTKGRDTVLYEIDFKQLEMVAVACISKCPDMIAALKRGDDLHYLSGKTVFGWADEKDMKDDQRKVVKAVNFGVLYGGKAKGLSYLTGVDQETIQKLIDGFYRQFPGVAKWQKKIYTEVVDAMYPYDTKNGMQRYGSTWRCPLGGRKYTFVEKEAPTWVQKKTHRIWSFSPTHTSNYPIQGFAGGDIVMYALTWLWRHHRDMKFIITVHDSIVIDSALGPSVIKDAVSEMCKATALRFNLPLELHCDVTWGTHWK